MKKTCKIHCKIGMYQHATDGQPIKNLPMLSFITLFSLKLLSCTHTSRWVSKQERFLESKRKTNDKGNKLLEKFI